MFSGIIEGLVRVLKVEKSQTLVRITTDRPSDFQDLKSGDSVACNGVCLTVEEFTPQAMQFALGSETLSITGWDESNLKDARLNVERSLRFGDRMHGHMVSGHVDAASEVISIEDLGGSTLFKVRLPEKLRAFVWKKGSWAVNGVSLTINEVRGTDVEMCLIPETLERTNLGTLKVGDRVNLEVDMIARGLVHTIELQKETPHAKKATP